MKFLAYIFFSAILLLFSSCNNDSSKHVKSDTSSDAKKDNNQLLLATDQLLKLKGIELRAAKNGVVLSNTNDMVEGKMLLEQDTFKVEVKIISNYNNIKNIKKNGYRVKISNGNYCGVRVLNLYPKESIDNKHFFIQKLSNHLGLLSPRSGLISIQIGSESAEDFFWQEHFEKQMLESQKRREAPILKFDIRPYKELLVKEKSANGSYDIDVFSKTSILPFSKKKTYTDVNLKGQFLNGNSLLEQLREGNYESLDDIINLNNLATFYVIKDLVLGQDNPLPWYNLRYFYNSTNAKLEPIVFALDVISKDHRIFHESLAFENNLRKDESFQSRYKDVKARLSNEYLENLIHSYNDEYFVDSEIPFEDLAIEDFIKGIDIDIQDSIIYEHPFYDPLPSMALKVVDVGDKLLITNLHTASITILGTGLASGILTPINKEVLSNSEIQIASDDPIVYYQTVGRNTLYTTSNIQFPVLTESVGQSIRGDAKIPKGFKQKGDSLLYEGQKIIYQSDVIIPKGYTVYFPAGSVMELKNCSFLSFSSVISNGTQANPVLFNSDNAQGFTVIDAEKKSRISHSAFNKFGNQLFEGWTLPGAVTFNNSDVEFSYCTFSNNTCEDALNIVNANFLVENCIFDNTFGDAFDADFCEGKVIGTDYSNIGNDAMDFSGSIIEISDCNIDKCGDKGISAGENSNLKVSGGKINGAIIGIASKDLSEVFATDVLVLNCQRNFAVFQKKKEYGPARIDISSKNISPSKLENIIDKNSVLILNNLENTGQKPIDVEALYN